MNNLSEQIMRSKCYRMSFTSSCVLKSAFFCILFTDCDSIYLLVYT